MVVFVQELRQPLRTVFTPRSVQTLRQPISIEKQRVTLVHVNSVHSKTLAAKHPDWETRRRDAGYFPILNQERR